jgi:hypothetical protein
MQYRDLSSLIIALAHALSCTAHAEVRVEGRIESVKVEIRDGSVEEALEALSATFGLSVRNSAVLDQKKKLNGFYQGSLRQVIAQLLTGRNYVMIHSDGKVEIRIFGSSDDGSSRPVTGQRGVPAPDPTVDESLRSFVPPLSLPNPATDKNRRLLGPR